MVTNFGQLLLVMLGVCWAIWERPAPIITIQWRDRLSVDERRRAERELRLANPQPSDDAWQYELWWPRTREIAAILEHPLVEDTGHIDRVTGTIADDAGQASVRVWWLEAVSGPDVPRRFRWLMALVGLATVACSYLVRRFSRPPPAWNSRLANR